MCSNKLIKKLPYWNVSNRRKLFNKIFKKDDVIDDKIEIPLFKNVILSYVAEEEFSKYLDKVEIIEHPFNHFIKKNGKYINKPQDQLWKAIFYFSKKPETGNLKVEFE